MSNTLLFKQALLSSGFGEYPPIRLECEYEKLENPPPFNKFEKAIRKGAKDYDRLWSLQLSIIQHFYEFKYIFNTCFTDRAFYYLLGKYAHLELELKEFSKQLKSTSDQNVKKYYTDNAYDELVSVNVFDLMKTDMEQYRVLAEQRHSKYIEKYGHGPVALLTDDVTDYVKGYKDAIKTAKAEREAIKKKAKA